MAAAIRLLMLGTVVGLAMIGCALSGPSARVNADRRVASWGEDEWRCPAHLAELLASHPDRIKIARRILKAEEIPTSPMIVGFRLPRRGELAYEIAGPGRYAVKNYGFGFAQSSPHISFMHRANIDRIIDADVARYLDAVEKERKFPAARMAKIRRTEELLPRDRMIFFKEHDRKSWTEEFLRIFEGSADEPLVLERVTSYQVPERELMKARNEVIGILEVGRALSLRGGGGEDTFRRLVVEIATYADQQYLSKGLSAVVYVHTDRAGRLAFRKFGLRVVAGPEELGEPGEYVLKVDAAELANRFGSRLLFWQEGAARAPDHFLTERRWRDPVRRRRLVDDLALDSEPIEPRDDWQYRFGATYGVPSLDLAF